MSKYELSLNSIADSQFLSNNSFTYFWKSFHTGKWKIVNILGKAISSALMLGRRYTSRQWSWQKFLSPQKWWPFWIFKVFAKHKNAYISKTVLYGGNSTKFLTCWVSLQSSHANFQNIFVSPNIADIFNFLIFCKTQKCLYLENRAR